ncbi:hypothetical protein BDZ45DRAFT_681554 [Acephala macrosclerotiorum]|nr:hypothetical protein BDZ45DRAFT_681554 [Acephala macrosclerotiorum]
MSPPGRDRPAVRAIVAVWPVLAFSDGLHFLVTWIDAMRTSESPRCDKKFSRRHRSATALTSLRLVSNPHQLEAG